MFYIRADVLDQRTFTRLNGCVTALVITDKDEEDAAILSHTGRNVKL